MDVTRTSLKLSERLSQASLPVNMCSNFNPHSQRLKLGSFSPNKLRIQLNFKYRRWDLNPTKVEISPAKPHFYRKHALNKVFLHSSKGNTLRKILSFHPRLAEKWHFAVRLRHSQSNSTSGTRNATKRFGPHNLYGRRAPGAWKAAFSNANPARTALASTLDTKYKTAKHSSIPKNARRFRPMT